jgi:endonuclease YncB( thermonuclease family)
LAQRRLRELTEDSVWVDRWTCAGDDYSRILYYVYTPEGESIDEMLVREGLALAWTRGTASTGMCWWLRKRGRGKTGERVEDKLVPPFPQETVILSI